MRLLHIQALNVGVTNTKHRRMNALNAPRSEMATVVSELRVRQALLSRTPAAATRTIQPGDYVRIFREGDRKFLGPHEVIKVEGKEIYINNNGRLVHHNLSQVIPVQSSYDSELTTLHHQLKPFIGSKYLDSPPLQKRAREKQTSEGTPEDPIILVTEVLQPGDPRGDLLQFQEAKRKEMVY